MLDVKVGRGAFMKTLEEARQLRESDPKGYETRVLDSRPVANGTRRRRECDSCGAIADGRAVDLSLMYFANDEDSMRGSKYELLMEGVKFADAHGFSAVWTPERHFQQVGQVHDGRPLGSRLLAALRRVAGESRPSCGDTHSEGRIMDTRQSYASTRDGYAATVTTPASRSRLVAASTIVRSLREKPSISDSS